MRALLASAAVLAGALPLAAGELAPAPHLGACGPAGGFLLPGTDACLVLGGFARAEAGWHLSSGNYAIAAPAGTAVRQVSAPLDRSVLGATARLTADVRVPTELGPVRAFVSLRTRGNSLLDR